MKLFYVDRDRLSRFKNYMTEEEKKVLYDRDEIILNAWLSGMNYRECGEPHGISGNRASQIICRELRKGYRQGAESTDEWRARVLGTLRMTHEFELGVGDK